MTINKNLIIGIVAIVVIAAGIIYVGSRQTGEIVPADQQVNEEEQVEDKEVVMLSIAGQISEINIEKGYLMVKPPKEDKEYKVIVSDATEMIKLEFPFDPVNPPSEGTFTPERTSISLTDLVVDDHILVETETNLFGKTEIDDVTRIQVLP